MNFQHRFNAIFKIMKRFSLRLTEAEYDKIKTYCEELHLSMNDVIRQLIREWTPTQQIHNKIEQNETNHH